MKKRFIALFVLLFIFSFNLSVMADEGHEQKEKNESADMHSEEEDTHSEEADTHSEKAEGDDHHGPVVETPPNYKVLGTYGAVNLSFILKGVWNKWFRRKGIK